MQINDVKRNVENLWSEASASWQDDMSKKYKIAVIDQMEKLLSSMALRQLKEIQE